LIALSAGWLLLFFRTATQPSDIRAISWPKSDILISGTIVSEVDAWKDRYGFRQDFVLETQKALLRPKAPSQPIRGLIKVTSRKRTLCQYGDCIFIAGTVHLPKGRRNPGGLDTRERLLRRGIQAFLSCGAKDRFKVVGNKGRPWVRFFIGMRAHFRKTLNRDFDARTAGILNALFFGERDGLDGPVQEAFARTGTLHLLAASGFNVGFVAAIVLIFLPPIFVSRRLAWAVALVGVWVYAFTVGWESPVMRAALMATVFIFSRLVGRRADALNALGFSAIVLLVLNPLDLFDLGFQLSFLAVCIIVIFAQPLLEKRTLLPHETETFFEKIRFYFKEIFWISVTCGALTLPLTVQSFYVVSPISPLANLVIIPATFLVYLIGAVYFPLSLFGGTVVAPVVALIKAIMGLTVHGLFLLERVPFSSIIVGKLHPALVCGLAGGFIYLFMERRIRRGFFRVAAVYLFAASIFIAQDLLRPATERFETTFLDVGQGDSAFIRFPNGRNLLVDGGNGQAGQWDVLPFLKSRGVRSLDCVILTHPEEDHFGGLAAIFGNLTVRSFIEGPERDVSYLYRSFEKQIPAECRRMCVSQGDRIEGFGTILEVLNPKVDALSKNPNDDSLVLKFTFGKDSFLLAGDVRRIPLVEPSLLRADVLKVPHHGGKVLNEREFFSTVSPRISVISVGERNRFGHPRQEIVDALESLEGHYLFRTDQSGAVRVVCDGKNLAAQGYAEQTFI